MYTKQHCRLMMAQYQPGTWFHNFWRMQLVNAR